MLTLILVALVKLVLILWLLAIGLVILAFLYLVLSLVWDEAVL